MTALENARTHYESEISIDDGIGVQLATTKSHITQIFPLAEHKTNSVDEFISLRPITNIGVFL